MTTTTTTTTTTATTDKKKNERWEQLLLKSEDYFESYTGRYQCSKLFYGSDVPELIPRHCRWILWSRFTRLHDFAQQSLPVNFYQNLLNTSMLTMTKDGDPCESETAKSVKQILLDIPRTCQEDLPLDAQQQMFHVLYALALFQPKVGYCQGMSHICAHVLSVMESEEDAFLLLAMLMQKFDMKDLFTPGFAKLNALTYTFDELFRKRDRQLWQHLSNLGVSSNFYLPKWYLSMFCMQFPPVFILRLWDVFLLYGWIAFHQVTLSLLNFHRKELLNCKEFETAMNLILNEMPNSVTEYYTRQKVFFMAPGMCSERDVKRLDEEFNSVMEDVKNAGSHA